MTKQSKIPFVSQHVEVKLTHEESIDSLCRKGFRSPYQIWWQTWLLERWDHPDGRYKLVAYKGGGLYMSEDVNDPQWKEIIDLVYREDDPPSLFTSENWFQLKFEHDPTGAFSGAVQHLSSSEIPKTDAEWNKFLRKYKAIVVEIGECEFSLQNGRSGESVFSDTLVKRRDGSVSMAARKKPKRSR
jgi:hypothetical protein